MGRTTISIAHRLSTVRDSHKLIVLDNGEVLESGTHLELVAREDGAYSQLLRAQYLSSAKSGGIENCAVAEERAYRSAGN